MKKKVWIFIGVIGIILLTSGGVLLIKSNPKEKEPDLPVIEQKPGDEKPPVEEIKEEPISLELAEELYNMVYDKLWCGYLYLPYYQYHLVTADTISNEDKNRMIIIKLVQERLKTQKEDWTFTKEEILKMKNQIFGENSSFDILLDNSCMSGFQRLEDDKYWVEAHCGPICSPSMSTKFVKTVRKGDKIYLDQLAVFNRGGEHEAEDEFTAYYYQDYDRTILLGKNEFNDSFLYFSNVGNIDWDYYQDKAGQYHFTYQVNDDGTYTFLQMERIK